jgi:hypothetical protein
MMQGLAYGAMENVRRCCYEPVRQNLGLCHCNIACKNALDICTVSVVVQGLVLKVGVLQVVLCGIGVLRTATVQNTNKGCMTPCTQVRFVYSRCFTTLYSLLW